MRVLRPLTGYLRHCGKDAATFLAAVGIDPLSLFDPNATIPHPLMLEVWRRAEQLLGDPSVGLHALERLEVRMFQHMQYESEYVVLQMFVSSATLGEGLARFARYFAVTFYGSRIHVERGAGLVRVRHQVLGARDVPRSFAEFILGLVARTIQELTVPPVQPREIAFAHPAPPSTADHERLLSAPVRFSAGEDIIVLQEADLDAPLCSANPALVRGLEQHAEELLARLPRLESFTDQVRALIAAELQGGNPNADHIARALSMSVRTLSRRLEELGTSHKALLDEVRAELARRYLVEDGRPINETAALLGFSEVSAFHRAFRRWYGCSPTDYRQGTGG
jgi:AraC-like DNA-binding protein